MKDNEILDLVKVLLKGGKLPLSLIKDKVNYRRAHVIKLSLQGHTQKEIAEQINCCVSTIEKDFYVIRGRLPSRTESGGFVCE